MQSESTDDIKAVVPATVSFCQGCRFKALIGGLNCKCVRDRLPGTNEYPTCLSERSSTGRCANGEHYSPFVSSLYTSENRAPLTTPLSEWLKETLGKYSTEEKSPSPLPAAARYADWQEARIAYKKRNEPKDGFVTGELVLLGLAFGGVFILMLLSFFDKL